MSQLWSRGDDRANANVASRRNGVVGMSGSKMPAIPHTVDTRPNVNQSARIGMMFDTHSHVSHQSHDIDRIIRAKDNRQPKNLRMGYGRRWP